MILRLRCPSAHAPESIKHAHDCSHEYVDSYFGAIFDKTLQLRRANGRVTAGRHVHTAVGDIAHNVLAATSWSKL
jgi:hypothetical protein